jgi:O-antigen/teichoic acid export membrane protein
MEEVKVKNVSNFNQALWLAIGQLGIFGLTFFSAAILSRYLSKEDYGIYRQILYVYVTLMSLFTIGLPSVFSYFIPKLNSNQQKTLISSLNKVFLVLGFLFSLSIYLFSPLIANILKNPELEIGLKIFSPFPFFTLPALGVEGIYTALRKTKLVAFYQIFSRFLMLIFIVLPVIFIDANYKIAIIGWGIASILTFAVAMYMKSKPYLSIEKETIPDMNKTILNYSLPLMGAFIAGFFIASADQFFISRYFGTEAFADYSNGSLSIPIVAVIAMSIKKVLLPIFSKAHTDNKIEDAIQTYVNAVNKSITIVFPLIVYCIFFANALMIIIYGNKYASSGSYFRFYLIRDFLEVLPYFSVFLALGLSRIYLYMHIAGVFFVWILGFIVVKSGMDATMIVLVRTIFYVLSTLFAMVYLYKKENINLLPRKILIQLVLVLSHSICCAFFIFALSNSFEINELPPVLLILITISVYYITIILSGRLIKINYLESVFMLINKKVKND